MKNNLSLLSIFIVFLFSLSSYSCRKEGENNASPDNLQLSLEEAKKIYTNQLRAEGVRDTITLKLVDWDRSIESRLLDSNVVFKVPVRSRNTKVSTFLIIAKTKGSLRAFYQQFSQGGQSSLDFNQPASSKFKVRETQRTLDGKVYSITDHKDGGTKISVQFLSRVAKLNGGKSMSSPAIESMSESTTPCCENIEITTRVTNSRGFICDFRIPFYICAGGEGEGFGDIYQKVINLTCDGSINISDVTNQIRNLLEQAISDVGANCLNSGDPDNPNWIDPDAPTTPGGGGQTPNPNNISVSVDANHAILCGSIASIAVGNSFTGGVENLGFTMAVTINGQTSTTPVVIGSSCFSTKNSSNVLASAAFLTAYNLAVEGVMYEVKYGIIPVVNSTTLRTALVAQINLALTATGGVGSSFSTGSCVGSVPSTVAKYCSK